MKQPISSIFLFKTLGTVFVVMIHFHFYKSEYLEPLFRCGVPIFFIIGGYFLYSSDRDELLDKAKHSIIKIVKLIVFFNVLYYFVNLLFASEHNFDLTDQHFLLQLFFYGDNISGHLWFLHSYLQSIIVIWVLAILYVKHYVWNLIAILLLVLCCLDGQYGFLMPFDLNVKELWVPWILMSFPMFVIGFNIHKYESLILSTVSAKMAMTGAALCIFMCYVEHRLFSMANLYTAETKLSTLILVSMLFVLCITQKEFGRNTWFETIGREHSANIYYWQFVPTIVVCPMIKSIGIQEVEFFVVLAVLIAWSYMINFINSKLRPILHY